MDDSAGKNKMEHSKSKNHFNGGFTMIELTVALAISGILLAGMIVTFNNQQRGYQTQLQVTTLHQNIRAAMAVVSGDVRMAGFYTRFDPQTLSFFNWNPTGSNNLRAAIGSLDNVTGQTGYSNGSDVIVIVKGGDERRPLTAAESAAAGSSTLTLTSRDLDGDGTADLDDSNKIYGVLVRSQYSRSNLFQISSVGGGVTVNGTFNDSYSENDFVARADIVVYRINDANANFNVSVLERMNFGDTSSGNWQAVAEYITDLQFQYIMDDGTVSDDPSADASLDTMDIRAVVITLTGQVTVPRAGVQQRTLTSTIKVRNLGI